MTDCAHVWEPIGGTCFHTIEQGKAGTPQHCLKCGAPGHHWTMFLCPQRRPKGQAYLDAVKAEHEACPAYNPNVAAPGGGADATHS